MAAATATPAATAGQARIAPAQCPAPTARPQQLSAAGLQGPSLTVSRDHRRPASPRTPHLSAWPRRKKENSPAYVTAPPPHLVESESAGPRGLPKVSVPLGAAVPAAPRIVAPVAVLVHPLERRAHVVHRPQAPLGALFQLLLRRGLILLRLLPLLRQLPLPVPLLHLLEGCLERMFPDQRLGALEELLGNVREAPRLPLLLQAHHHLLEGRELRCVALGALEQEAHELLHEERLLLPLERHPRLLMLLLGVLLLVLVVKLLVVVELLLGLLGLLGLLWSVLHGLARWAGTLLGVGLRMARRRRRQHGHGGGARVRRHGRFWNGQRVLNKWLLMRG